MRFLAALLALFLAACSSPPRRTDKSLRDLTPEDSAAIQTNETEVLDALGRIREAQSFEEQQKAETQALENSVPRGKETPEVTAAQAKFNRGCFRPHFFYSGAVSAKRYTGNWPHRRRSNFQCHVPRQLAAFFGASFSSTGAPAQKHQPRCIAFYGRGRWTIPARSAKLECCQPGPEPPRGYCSDSSRR